MYKDELFKAWKDRRIEGNIIKDLRNVCRLKKEIDDIIIKDMRNPFRLKKREWHNIKQNNQRY